MPDFINADIITTGTTLNTTTSTPLIADGSDIYVAQGVNVVSTGGRAVDAQDIDDFTMTVAGSVVAQSTAIRVFDGDPAATIDFGVTILQGGIVSASTLSAVNLFANDTTLGSARINNAGTIHSEDYSAVVTFLTMDYDLVNSGIISSNSNNVIFGSAIFSQEATDVRITNSGSITNTASTTSTSFADIDSVATIRATTGSFAAPGSVFTLTNTGLISGGSHSIFANHETIRITNLGTLDGTVAIDLDVDGTFRFVNGGDVIGDVLSGDTATDQRADTILNDGTIRGDITLNRGDDVVHNTGAIFGDVDMGEDADMVRNTGQITGTVTGGADSDTVINSGTISGDVTAETVRNSGTIMGNVTLDISANTYVGIGQGSVGGIVDGGAGNDTLIGAGQADMLLGGSDNDYLRGNAGADTLDGGLNDDSILGDAGDDMLVGSGGADTMRGGTGDDLLDGGTENDSLFGNDGHDTMLGGDGADVLIGGLGEDSLEGGLGDDTLNGGSGRDELFGGDDNDMLRGDGEADVINGEDGDDTLQGGAGDDTITGGLGRDILNGGSGADQFRFTATNQSAVGALRDVIQDFEVGVDTIDLGAMPGVLSYVGGAALPGGGTAAVRAVEVGVNTLVQIDTDGNGTIDSEILLSFTSGVMADDFIL